MVIISHLPSRAAVSVTIGNNFTGATLGVDSDAVPPDCNGVIGPTNFVQFINGRFTVFDKVTGVVVQTMIDRDFWSSAGAALPNNLDASDPRLVYDRESQRWFACQVDVDQTVQITNRFLLAVSKTDDPTRGWTGFGFRADPQGRTFADFPTLGVDSQGVYLGAELFDDVGNDIGPMLVALPKAPLLSAAPSITDRTQLGSLPNGAVPQSAVSFGETSGGEPVLAIGDLGQDFNPHNTLAAYTVSFPSGGGPATLSNSQVLTVPSYSVPINPPQPNGLNNLDNGDARISSSVYRVGDVVYAVHSTEVNKRAAVQWFKIDALNFTILQTDILTDPTLDLFYPSIAANADGTVVIAFNGSSLQTYVGSYVRVGELINGTVVFGPNQLLKSGAASYLTNDSSGTSRWGDYSSTSVDPLEPTHFWVIQAIPARRTAWSTQITEVILSSDLMLTIARGPNDLIVSWPTNAVGAQLQFTPSLSTTNWNIVSGSPTVVSNLFQLTLPGNGTNGFFRLLQQ